MSIPRRATLLCLLVMSALFCCGCDSSAVMDIVTNSLGLAEAIINAATWPAS